MNKKKIKDYKFKFSVVIPIYNVEKYLEETIESVINQTIGFEKNIQMILVNDESPDNSDEICRKYKELYSDNIIYIKQKNSGVSSARNKGMEYVEGKYVNFLDSDDKWENDAFEKVWKYFEDNYEKIDCVSCRMKHFDASEKYHILDYKFSENRVINILNEYDSIQLHITSYFLKSSILNQYKFNTILKYGEDSEFITNILLEKKTYGLMKDVTHYYRKRKDNTSAVQNRKNKIEWYTDTVELFYKGIINKSKKLYGEVIPYIQFLIMYDIQYRINAVIPDGIEEDIKTSYIKNLKEVLKYIDDYIICEQKQIKYVYKLYALSLKYNRDIRSSIEYRKGIMYFNNIPIYELENNDCLKIMILDIKDDNLILEGQINTFIQPEYYNIYFEDNNKKIYNVEYYKLYNNPILGLEGEILNNRGFRVKIPLKQIKSLSIKFTYKSYIHNVLVKFGRLAKLNEKINKSYYAKEKYILKIKNNQITVESNTKLKHLQSEIKYLIQLLKMNKLGIIRFRVLYYILKIFMKKEIWLISDRNNKANDNGEHFFRYINKIKNKKIKPYFVIEKDSEDYRRMKEIGKVINYGSVKYRLYFLMSSKIISSQINDYVINAFDKRRKEYLRDLYRFDVVFLQHGITKDDLSGWVHKFSKNIKLFITAGNPEYKSIVEGNYNYDTEVVKLTGFARYDELYKKSKNKTIKKILIVPTWRKSIKGSYIESTGESIYLDTFKDTEYFKFYNNLINDERILRELKDTGYKIKLCMHPSHAKQYIDFNDNDFIEINHGYVNYQNEFIESDLLITDYSSVFFDFAYLNKPIIYTQFDKDSFFDGGHAYTKGYFNYDENGFGPVCYDYEETVKEIVNTIKNKCILKDKYKQRINKFYAYNDDKNCERIYKEILNIK